MVWATEIYDEDDVWDVETSCNDGCCHHYIFDALFEILESVFNEIKECEEGRDVNRLLKGPVAHSSFQRLN